MRAPAFAACSMTASTSGFARQIVADRELRRAERRLGETRVMGEIVASPSRKLEPALQLEECNGAVLELRTEMPSVGSPSPSR